ncbi:MAG: PQQ-binding-like beta-propeller repeat protein [Thermoguttaceae bacterium]|jgi:outer membrane protein assembly factor BamB
MNILKTLVAFALSLWVMPSVFAGEPDKTPDAATTVTPAGEYQTAWLTLNKGWENGADVRVFLGLRGGQGTTAWFVGPARSDCHYMWLDQIALKLEGDRLKGDIRGRMVKQWAPIAHTGDYVCSFNAKVTSGQVTGAFTIAITPTGQQPQNASGNLTGTLQTEQQAKAKDALPVGKNWPWWYGAGSAMRGPACGAKMIESLNDARPVWKSEDAMPGMWGKGPDGRYQTRVLMTGCDGGASSPVVADGLVYQFYFRPSGPIKDATVYENNKAIVLKDDAQAREKAATLTTNPIAQRAYVDWSRPLADDFVVCLDAATGKTVWKAALPGRSGNGQTHKWRGFNPTPCVHDGIVYVVNYASYLYALDTKSGKLLWEHVGTKGSFGAGAAGPAVAEGTVVVQGQYNGVALDAKTGKELWKGPGGNVLNWNNGGREYFVVDTSCVDPKTGKVLWKLEAKNLLANTWRIIDGDYLLGTIGAGMNAEGGQLVCYRLSPTGAEQKWIGETVNAGTLAVHGGHVYAQTGREMICVKLEDGQLVAKLPMGNSTSPMTTVADGRLFFRPEGRHGPSPFMMCDANPSAFRLLTEGAWGTLNPTDSAYAVHTVVSPVVDGRMFIRGHDGVYCYDLRKTADK